MNRISSLFSFVGEKIRHTVTGIRTPDNLYIFWMNKRININNGSETAGSDRVCSQQYIPLTESFFIRPYGNTEFSLRCYDSEQTYIPNPPTPAFVNEATYFYREQFPAGTAYFRIVARYNDNSTINANDFDSLDVSTSVVVPTFSPTSPDNIITLQGATGLEAQADPDNGTITFLHGYSTGESRLWYRHDGPGDTYMRIPTATTTLIGERLTIPAVTTKKYMITYRLVFSAAINVNYNADHGTIAANIGITSNYTRGSTTGATHYHYSPLTRNTQDSRYEQIIADHYVKMKRGDAPIVFGGYAWTSVYGYANDVNLSYYPVMVTEV